MKKDKISIILLVFLVIGASLLLYPSLADWWNSSRSTKIGKEYEEELAKLSSKKIDEIREQGHAYNESLGHRPYPTEMSAQEEADYYSQLRLGSTDVMSKVEVPSINLNLPVYHGTKESLLQTSLGHIEWTSLPLGGEGTHTVITGHRGLVSARLFSDIDRLTEGDIFYLYTLGEKLTYKVDQITIVLPHEIQNLLRADGKDYASLLTCTPYGINTHRLIVRGIRIPTEDKGLYLSSEARRVSPYYVSVGLMLPMACLVGIVTVIRDRKRQRKGGF